MSDPVSTKIQSDEIGELLNRSELYGMLALLYRHPSSIKSDLLDREQKAGWKEAVAGVHFSNKIQMATSMNLIIKTLDETPSPKRVSLYEDCFSHTAHGAVSGYELEYGEEHSHRQPQQLGDIAAFYQAFGLKMNEKSHERVDHVSVESEFMHFLCFKEAYALEHDGKDKAEVCHQAVRRFLAEHLGRWAPSFALRLSKDAREGLFKHLADFTLSFIIQDCQGQDVSAGPKDLPMRSVIEKMDAGCGTCSLKAGLPAGQAGFQC